MSVGGNRGYNTSARPGSRTHATTTTRATASDPGDALILAAAARINDQRVDSTISKVGAIPSGVSQRVRDARVNEILDLVVEDIVEELTEQLGSASPQRTYALLEWSRQTALPIVLRRAIRD